MVSFIMDMLAGRFNLFVLQPSSNQLDSPEL